MKRSFKILLAMIFAIATIVGMVPFYVESVEAASENSSVISIDDFADDSKEIANDISRFVLFHQKRFPNTRKYTVGSKQEFINTWNKMAKKQTVVFINAHGNPLELWAENERLLSVSDVNSLQWKEISFIVLRSCNCGHYDWKNENIARALADRFRCAVIACDGVTRGHNPFGVYEEPSWKKYCSDKGSSRTDAKGWLVYIPKSSSNNYQGKLYQIKPLAGAMTVREMLTNYCNGNVVPLSVK